MNNRLIKIDFETQGTARGRIYQELAIEEHGLLHDHILRLSPESRLMRFGCPTSDYMLDRYCANQNQPTPIICGAFIDGVLRGVVELRFGGELPRNAAEIGISVEDNWRNQGIGAELMALAFKVARARGLEMLEMNFVPHNGPIRRLAQRFGAKLTNQMGLVRARFDLKGNERPAPVSPKFAA